MDCKSEKKVLQKDVQNLLSKQTLAHWQAILLVFDFEIEFINREKIPFLTSLCGNYFK